MKKNIILVGFMGAGKSLIAKMLAPLCGKTVVSTDEIIVKREGRPITDIFKDPGEPYFRKLEKEVVKELSGRDNLIVDCGGGIVLDPDNLTSLKKRGVVFYLAASAPELFRRVKKETHRPLLNTADPQARIDELLKKRKSFYEQADITIDTNGKSPDVICQEILKRFPAF